jgi:hypothetical protein
MTMRMVNASIHMIGFTESLHYIKLSGAKGDDT